VGSGDPFNSTQFSSETFTGGWIDIFTLDAQLSLTAPTPGRQAAMRSWVEFTGAGTSWGYSNDLARYPSANREADSLSVTRDPELRRSIPVRIETAAAVKRERREANRSPP